MEKNNISAKDYTHLNGVSGPVPTIDQMEQVVIENFQKGRTTEEIFLGGLNVLDKLEKGKRGTVGEVREWSGKKYQKTVDGWVPMKEGDTHKREEDVTGKSEEINTKDLYKKNEKAWGERAKKVSGKFEIGDTIGNLKVTNVSESGQYTVFNSTLGKEQEWSGNDLRSMKLILLK